MTTNGVRGVGYEPEYARIPPHVTTYPNPPAYFRQTPAEKYTCPEGKASYSKWWDKWHYDAPEYRDEHYRQHSRFPMMRRDEGFHQGLSHLPRARPHVTSDLPPFYTDYLPRLGGDTVSEAMRARAINRVHFARRPEGPPERDLLYAYSNAMTGTQYQKPVPGLYGPMLRREPYGVKILHNRHGFMPSNDYYF